MDISQLGLDLSARLVEGLNYGAPIAVTTCFASAYTYNASRPAFPTRCRGVGKSTWKIALYLMCTVTAISIARNFLYIHNSLQEARGLSSHDKILHALMQTLLWTTLTLLDLSSSRPAWMPYTTSWALAAVLEIAILLLQPLSDYRSRPLDGIQNALQASTAAGMAALSLMGTSVLYTSKERSWQDETQSLLDSEATSTSGSRQSYHNDAASEDEDSGSDSSSICEDSDSEQSLVKKARQRIEEDGGWINYASEYLMFWPYIWPSRNVKLQSFFWILAISTLAERALNVLYPRQFGIVVDKLYRSAGAGTVPWREILLWIFYELLRSDSCGLPGLNLMLENRISNWSHMQLSVTAFDQVMGLPMSFHDSKDSGEVIKAVEQASSLNSLLRTLLLDTVPFVLDMVIACWYFAYLLDAYATLIFVAVGIAFCFVTYHIGIIMKHSRRATASTERAESRILYEKVSNWATVSYFNRRKYEQLRLADTVGRSIKASQWDNDVSIYMFGAQELCELVGRLILTILAAYRIAMGTIPVGNFVALESYWDTIVTPLWMLSHSYRQLSSDLIDAERLLQLFKRKSTIEDGLSTFPAQPVARIEFSNVFFGYRQYQNTLEDISFVASPGQTVALVGQTGSGKSTMTKLLMRFYDVTAGSIEIDGQDIRSVTLHSLREAFGFVPQNAALFNMSILDNVRYGKLDATEAEVHEACKAAALHDQILTFPNGYHTKVGERGVKLSGGELQRIAIARVILKDPQIVLLDEATSALDTGTEAKIQEALRRLTRGRTTLVIAHRLSTVTNADLILVVDKGRIVERGTHAELLRLNGRYVENWARQTVDGSCSGQGVG